MPRSMKVQLKIFQQGQNLRLGVISKLKIDKVSHYIYVKVFCTETWWQTVRTVIVFDNALTLVNSHSNRHSGFRGLNGVTTWKVTRMQRSTLAVASHYTYISRLDNDLLLSPPVHLSSVSCILGAGTSAMLRAVLRYMYCIYIRLWSTHIYTFCA
jgi:hypothetical protein